MGENTKKKISQLSYQLDSPLTEQQAAEILGVAVQTLRNWRHLRRGPAYCKYGNGKIIYMASYIRTFQEKHRVDPEAA